jgi:Regulator of chromosome condensation (RCC1) repeat
VAAPTLIGGLENAEITNIACGNVHAFAWSATTQLIYGWGCGQNGRLGNDTDDVVAEPAVLESFRELTRMGIMSVRQVVCGENHTLALVDMVVVDDDQKESEVPNITTKLFVWGANDKRQLGMTTDPISPILCCEESNSADAGDCLSNGAGGSTSTINQDLRVPH